MRKQKQDKAREHLALALPKPLPKPKPLPRPLPKPMLALAQQMRLLRADAALPCSLALSRAVGTCV